MLGFFIFIKSYQELILYLIFDNLIHLFSKIFSKMFAIESELTNNVVDEQNNKTENNCKCYTTMNCEYYKSVTGMAVYLVDEILYEASSRITKTD